MDSTKTNELFDPDPLSMCMIPNGWAWISVNLWPYHKSGISRGMMPMGFSPDNQYELFYYDFPKDGFLWA